MLNESTINKLKILRLYGWIDSWERCMRRGADAKQSFEALLTSMIDEEFDRKQGCAFRRRIAKAKILDEWRIETYPFDRQPKLDRRKLMAAYDAMDYLEHQRNIVWIGPTGCGKTALATAFLMQALERGHSGRLVGFAELIHEL
ncbi:MAG: ATP-binding protein, partial [Planctomycetes bacterium]|nr:ATP-binding protein [Planctomycetota bacterium]